MSAEDFRSIDWDEPGAFTIVVQGGLSTSNVVETALHCRHWRSLFPTAQIILAISVSEIFSRHVRPGVLVSPKVAWWLRDDSGCRLALAEIFRCCDTVVLSEGALPLPPIKADTKGANNLNLQIAAAKAGLAEATGRFVLRVRSDLVFSDRNFIDQYVSGAVMPRGKAAVLRQRVLISPLYTLNPFTYERLPLHYSDWFNLGTIEDVRELWDVPELPYADATYYKTHDCTLDSNADERLFYTRLAAEQHLCFNALKKYYPELELRYHNEQNLVDQSIDVLVDNFVVCDLVKARCLIEKYAKDIGNPAKEIHCVTASDWTSMAAGPPSARRWVLEQKYPAMARPESVPFPRSYPAQALFTQIGRRLHGNIVVRRGTGTLVHGPYDTLPKGHYLATVHVPIVTGIGTLNVRVTLGAGREVLAEREFSTEQGPFRELQIPFELSKTSSNFEVVCNVRDIESVVVSGVTIAANQTASGTFERALTADALSTQIGSRQDGRIVGSSTDGVLVYGPYHPLPNGDYVAALHIAEVEGAGLIEVRITLDGGQTVLAERRFEAGGEPIADLLIPFTIDRPANDVESVLSIRGIERIAVAGVTFSSA